MFSLCFGQDEVLMPYIKGDLYGYANAKGEIIVEPKYTYTSPFRDEVGKFVLCESLGTNNKYGLIDQTGRVILEPIARHIEPFDSNGFAIVKDYNYTLGIINKQGDWIIPLKYKHIEVNSQFIMVQNAEGFLALFDLNGKLIVDFEFNLFQLTDTDLVVIRHDNQYGLIRIQDSNYEMLIKPQYDYIGFLDNQLFVAEKGDKYGVVNQKNQVIIPFEFDKLKKEKHLILAENRIPYKIDFKVVENMSDNSFQFRRLSQLEKEFDDTNKIVYYLVPKEYKESLFFSGFDTNEKTYKRVINNAFNNNGEAVFSAEPGNIEVKGNHLIEVRSDKGVKLYDTKGKLVSSGEFNDVYRLSEGIMVVRYSTSTVNQFKYGFIDTTGKVIIPLEFDEAYSFYGGCAPVKQNNKWALINKKGKLMTEFKYDHLQYAGDRRYAFCIENHWGVLDFNGNMIMPAKYKEYGRGRYKKNEFGAYTPINFKDGTATVYRKLPGFWQPTKTLIDTNGVQIFPFKYNEIVPLEGGLYKVQYWIKELERDRVGIVDTSNNEIIPVYQREINWLPVEQVYQVYSQDNEYSYYDKTGKRTDSPYKEIERNGFREYRKLPNGFYAANYRSKTIYFTPEGVMLYKK